MAIAENIKNFFKMPILVKIVVLFCLLYYTGLGRFIPNIRALSALTVSLLSLCCLLLYPSRIIFPIKLWIPWIVFLLFRAFISDYNYAIYRPLLMIAPMLYAAGLSVFRFKEKILDNFINFIHFYFIFLLLFAVKNILLGHHFFKNFSFSDDFSGFVGIIDFFCLFASFFITLWSNKKGSHYIVYCGVILFLAFVNSLRGVIVTLLFTIPCNFFSAKKISRMVVIVTIPFLFLFLFNTERMQRKNFHSNKGVLEDISFENEDFSSNARKIMWDRLILGILDNPWWGHGSNASGYCVDVAGGGRDNPHNDYLRLIYDFGFIGFGIFVLTILAQLKNIYEHIKTSKGIVRLFFILSLNSYIPFLLLMMFDNVILYVMDFLYLQYTVITFAYIGYANQIRKPERG
jgi:O-antigen ligase